VGRSISLTVNGEMVTADVEPRLLLVHFIRERLRLTGTHIGCDTSHCGACIVLLDGVPVKSCAVLAVQAAARRLSSVEALPAGGNLHPFQPASNQNHGLQCGFCPHALLLSTSAL